ncbi:hypothetical protein GCM10009759_55190 [Kitasatospora saccharophila]|uniref:Uncharacterized protein n=1 Tax=Kitasatospora saccharophila TaxID=407973 RepID=A0ABN2XJQ2_9ACTN
MYCTVAQARAAGCTGTDGEVIGWISRAQAVVDAYTQQAFEPTDLTVAGTVSPTGLILLPRRVRTVSAVRLGTGPGDSDHTIPATAYRVTSSSVLGQVDAVQLAQYGYDDLVAGAESYSGGWANLWCRWGSSALVDGSFGYDTPPPGVDLATAMVAAWSQLVATGQGTAGGGVAPGGIQVDDEGNNVVIEPATSDDTGDGPSTPRATTGVPQADVLLSLYRNDYTLIGGA